MRFNTTKNCTNEHKQMCLLEALVQFTAWACESLGRDCPKDRAVKKGTTLEALKQQHHSGGLLMLELVTDSLLADFICRMQVFTAHFDPGSVLKPTDLLQKSFLGELLQVRPHRIH